MLSKGVAIDAKNVRGFTALHFAILAGNTLFAKELIRQGANPSQLFPCGASPLFKAAERGPVTMFKLFLNEQNVEKVEKGVPLLVYVAQKKINFLKVILAYSLNLAACDAHGNTAAHYLAKRNEAAMLALLAQKGARLDRLNLHGKTPADLTLSTEVHQVIANWQSAQVKKELDASAYEASDVSSYSDESMATYYSSSLTLFPPSPTSKPSRKLDDSQSLEDESDECSETSFLSKKSRKS